jgi:hypothetical protein
MSVSWGLIERYRSYTPSADAQGDIDALSPWAGQGGGLLITRLQPSAGIVREIAAEAHAALQRLQASN